MLRVMLRWAKPHTRCFPAGVGVERRLPAALQVEGWQAGCFTGGKDRKAVARLGRSMDDGGQRLERLKIERAATSTGTGGDVIE
jgi:hypothetical protein